MTSRAEYAARIALVGLGIVLGLALLEGALQLAAVFVSPNRLPALPASVGTTRLLCVGDSNTYGLWVERQEAYPQVLERLWNGDATRGTLEALNLGVPGMTTSKLRNALPGLLDAFAPDMVAISVGANDPYMVAEPLHDHPEARDSLWSRVGRASRLHRFAVVLARAGAKPALETDLETDQGALQGTYKARFGGRAFAFDWHFGTGDPSATQANLAAMIDVIRQAGARPILVTYASANWWYAPGSTAMRAVAHATGTPLIELAPAFVARCREQPCPLFFPDGHPTADGYAVAAEVVLAGLRASPER